MKRNGAPEIATLDWPDVLHVVTAIDLSLSKEIPSPTAQTIARTAVTPEEIDQMWKTAPPRSNTPIVIR